MEIIKNFTVFSMGYRIETNIRDQKANVRDQNQFDTNPCFCIRYTLKPMSDIVIYQGHTEVPHTLHAWVAISYLAFKEKQ